MARDRGYRRNEDARWWCIHCEKHSYPSRKAARLAAKRQPEKGRMPAYECPAYEGWHVGHLPRVVRTGEVGRDIYDYRYETLS